MWATSKELHSRESSPDFLGQNSASGKAVAIPELEPDEVEPATSNDIDQLKGQLTHHLPLAAIQESIDELQLGKSDQLAKRTCGRGRKRIVSVRQRLSQDLRYQSINEVNRVVIQD